MVCYDPVGKIIRCGNIAAGITRTPAIVRTVISTITTPIITARSIINDFFTSIDKIFEKIYIIIIMHALHHRCYAFKPHSCINGGFWQRFLQNFTPNIFCPNIFCIYRFIFFKLHENQIIYLYVSVAIFISTARQATFNMLAMIVKNLRAVSAGANIPHGPVIIIRVDLNNAV